MLPLLVCCVDVFSITYMCLLSFSFFVCACVWRCMRVMAGLAFFNNLVRHLSMLFVATFLNTEIYRYLVTTAITKIVELSWKFDGGQRNMLIEKSSRVVGIYIPLPYSIFSHRHYVLLWRLYDMLLDVSVCRYVKIIFSSRCMSNSFHSRTERTTLPEPSKSEPWHIFDNVFRWILYASDCGSFLPHPSLFISCVPYSFRLSLLLLLRLIRFPSSSCGQWILLWK